MVTRGHGAVLDTLICQALDLEELGSSVQVEDAASGLAAARTLESRYRKWYAESLEVLPDDLQDPFRREYEAGFPQYLIKYFLQDPRKESVIYSDDMDEASKKIWSRWQYPFQEKFVGPLRSQVGILERARARLGSSSVTLDALGLLELIGRRLPVSFAILQSGHRQRSGIEIVDEYSVQHVLHAVTVLHFDEVEPEEPTPKMAGASSRLDFLIKQEEVAVETKMMRPDLSVRRVRDELAADIVYFRAHPHVRALFILVYDPLRKITNSLGFERDLDSASSDDFLVRTVVSR